MLLSKQKILLFIAGTISISMILAFYFHLVVYPRIGTVNITGLIDQFIKEESKKNVSSVLLKDHIRLFSQQLETTIQSISKQKQVVLVPREAVLAGSKDYTALVETHLNTVLVN